MRASPKRLTPASGYESNPSFEFAHILFSPCKPVSLAPCSPYSERYRLLRRSMGSAIRVVLTYSSDQRAPRTRHDLRERTCLLRPVALEAQAGLQEPSCTAGIGRIQALRI